MRYRILHIPTGTWINKEKVNDFGRKIIPVEYWFKWRADRFINNLPEKFMFLTEDKRWVTLLKAELIVIPVATNRILK
jgi:hypothetical protein